MEYNVLFKLYTSCFEVGYGRFHDKEYYLT